MFVSGQDTLVCERNKSSATKGLKHNSSVIPRPLSIKVSQLLLTILRVMSSSLGFWILVVACVVLAFSAQLAEGNGKSPFVLLEL